MFDNIRKKLFPPKHDFDLDAPIVDEITTTHHYKLSGTEITSKMIITGFQCKKCGKILWLDKSQIQDLPRSMKYCKINHEN
jgi:hypothetical protein